MSRLMLLSLTATLVGAVLAGCITDEDPLTNVPPVLPDLTQVIDLQHDTEDGHSIAALHAKSSDNMGLVAFNSLAHEDGTYNDGNAEVSVLGDYAYVATLGKDSGFVIVDISDPQDPTVVGRYSNPNVYSPDVKVTWDGQYAILSSHPGTTLASHLPPEANVLPSRATDPLAYTEEDHVTGVTLVDVSDPANPTRVAEYIAEPNGVHNTEYAEIDGKRLIFSVDRNNVAVLEIRDTATGVELVPVAEIFADDHWRDALPGRLGSTNPNSYLPSGSHDVVYQQHPITKDHLVYIAFGSAGFYVYNVNDPTAPSMVSTWRGLPEGSGYYHYARPADILIDDYHITVVAPELFNGADTGVVALLDTTDPRNPEELGVWTLPGEDLLIEGNYRFSPHNIDIVNGTMYLANYHAGVWAIDLTCDQCLFEPQATGYYLPHEETDRLDADGNQVCAFWCERPFVWGVVMDRDTGLLYASDVESGLYVIDYEADFYQFE